MKNYEAQNQSTGENVLVNTVTANYAKIERLTDFGDGPSFYVSMGNSRYHLDGPIHDTVEEACNAAVACGLTKRQAAMLQLVRIGEYIGHVTQAQLDAQLEKLANACTLPERPECITVVAYGTRTQVESIAATYGITLDVIHAGNDGGQHYVTATAPFEQLFAVTTWRNDTNHVANTKPGTVYESFPRYASGAHTMQSTCKRCNAAIKLYNTYCADCAQH